MARRPQSRNWPAKRRALVLAGGGMRVAYQAGAVLALEQAGLSFELMDGASGGTMNLAMLLSGASPAQMCERWRTLDVREFASQLTLREYLTPGGLPALGSADGIRERVFPHLGIDIAKIRAATGVQGTFNVCNYSDKLNVAVPHQEACLELLVAGVSLPMFMPVVQHADKLWVDAVWIKDANLTEMVMRGAEEVWLIWCIGNTTVYNPGTLEQYVHMIEIAANASLFKEFDWIRTLNAQIEAGQVSPYGQQRPVVVHVLKPEYALPLDPDYFLGRIDANTLVGMGYSDACKYLSSCEANGVELEPGATRMKAPHRGVAFRERLTGALRWVESPGADSGGARAVTIAGAVDIPELGHFAETGGNFYGSIDVEGLGEYLPLFSGNFAIARGASGPRVRFGACFSKNGIDYQFTGERVLNVEPHASGPQADGQSTLQLSAVPSPGSAATPEAVGSVSHVGGPLAFASSLRSTGTLGMLEGSEVVLEFAELYGGLACAAALRPQRKPWWKFW